MVRAVVALLPLVAIASDLDETALLAHSRVVKRRSFVSPFNGECPAGFVHKNGKPGGQPLGGGKNGYIDRDTAFESCTSDSNCCAVSETNHPGNDANLDTGKKFRLGTCGGWEEHDSWKSCVPNNMDYYMADPKASCPEADQIHTWEECQEAGAFFGYTKGTVTHSGNEGHTRPVGCFWDQNGRVYLNTDPNAEADWAGVGGMCRRIPEPTGPTITLLGDDNDYHNADFDGDVSGESVSLAKTSPAAYEIFEQADETVSAKPARQARRVFNKAYFRSKRDCSEDARMPNGTAAPCNCTMSKNKSLKRREKFDHCDPSERSEDCIVCEKSRFLYHLGVGLTDGADADQTTVASTDSFCKAILSGNVTELQKSGYRVHPQQSMRWLNHAWEKARCHCIDTNSQGCDEDGGIVDLQTGESTHLNGVQRQCRNVKFHEIINQLKKELFTEKKKKVVGM